MISYCLRIGCNDRGYDIQNGIEDKWFAMVVKWVDSNDKNNNHSSGVPIALYVPFRISTGYWERGNDCNMNI